MQTGSPSYKETEDEANPQEFRLDQEHGDRITTIVRESKSPVRFTELKAFGE